MSLYFLIVDKFYGNKDDVNTWCDFSNLLVANAELMVPKSLRTPHKYVVSLFKKVGKFLL